MRALVLTVTDIGWRLPSLDAGLGNGTYSTNVPNCAEQVLYFDFNEIAEGGVSSAGSRRGAGMAMTFSEPIEHQRGRENHGGRIGEPLAHDIGRGAVTRLEHRVSIADVGGGRHSHAADHPGGQIGDDVTEHV